jgi:hypothetical protein
MAVPRLLGHCILPGALDSIQAVVVATVGLLDSAWFAGGSPGLRNGVGAAREIASLIAIGNVIAIWADDAVATGALHEGRPARA